MKFGLVENIIEKIVGVLEEQPKIDRAYIFGSRSKGNYRPDSDIDIAIKGHDLTVEDILKTSAAIDKSGIKYEVDLIDYDSINEEALKDHIDRVGIELYNRDKTYLLEEVVEKFIDYRGKTPKKTTEGVPLITAKIVKGGKILEPTEFISELDYLPWMTRGFPEIGDIILTTEAPLGEVALLKNRNVALAQRVIAIRTKKEVCNNIFLKYYFEGPEGHHALLTKASGSTVEGIKSAELKKVKINIPPLHEQIRIADVLSVLDDKIDLLHLQNKTLESMAESLFRKWFMVEQKDSPLIKISDVAEINPDTISSIYPHSFIEYLDTGSITRGSIEQYQEYSLSEAPSRAQRIIKQNDIVYSLVRPIQRHYGILDNIKPNTIASTGFCVIRCKELWTHYIYILLTIKENVEYFDMVAEGSTSAYPSLRPSDIAEFEFSLPDQERLKEFSENSIDTWKKIKANKNQIITVTAARDALLAKLLSGEARVKMS